MNPNSSPIWQGHLAESLIQSINVWVNVCDNKLNILVWNLTAERICGYSAAEVVGHPRIWEWLYPDISYQKEVLELTSNVLVADGNIRDVETQICCKNGDSKTIAWYSRPLINDENCVQGFVTFGYDVTDKKRAERALQKAHNDLHVLYEIASITNEITNLNQILDRSLERILSVMKSVWGTIHLWDTEMGRLVAVANRGTTQQNPDMDFVYSVYNQAQHIQSQIPCLAKHEKSLTFLGVPMRAKGRVNGVISIRVEDGSLVNEDDIALLSLIADQIGIAVENAALYRQSQQLAVAEERRRLARDMHDSVTQSLYSLTLFAEAGQRLLRAGDTELAEKYLERLNQTAQEALKEMRLLLYELRPWAFESGKLVETIQHRLESVERRSGLTAHLFATPLPVLPPRFEDDLYHIALEALNNALKHASASIVTVRIGTNEDFIQVEVTDNGTGFNPSQSGKNGGMGLANMSERAEEIGGTLKIDSSIVCGTTVNVLVPLSVLKTS